MENDSLTEIVPSNWKVRKSLIKVVGVGGGGCNAVEYMFDKHIEGCEFVVCNTDSQALGACHVPNKIQLGEGLGAGTDPISGRNAAIGSQDEIAEKLFGIMPDMLFITCGMGGGTGTGAAPVIASMSRERGILTVAVVTIPFRDNGTEAMTKAQDGIAELEKNVDSLLIIDNEKLYEQYPDLLCHEAFPKVDDVLYTAVKGIIDIISKHGHINVDFKDVKTMMTDSGMALMGYGEGSGENRIADAVKGAFESPLLNEHDLQTAQNVLLNITVGLNDKGLTMSEMKEIDKLVSGYIGKANMFKKGQVWNPDPDFGDKVTITAIVTGFDVDLDGIGFEGGDSTIVIPADYHYDRNTVAQNGITLKNTQSQKIGFNNKAIKKPAVFGTSGKPALIIDRDSDKTELENTTALRRRQKNE